MILSIVTINYNNAEGLRKTLASVASQSYKQIEHVIVDAASTDDSVDIIKEYAANAVYPIIWSSEKDNGVYDGMNKGIRKATGDYVWILNSGDCIANPDTVERMMNVLTQGMSEERRGKRGIDILLGNMIRIYPNGRMNAERGRRKEERGKPQPIETSMLTFYRGTVPQDAAFVRRDLFEKYGFFDDQLKIVSDWKLYLNMIALGDVKPKYVNIDVVLFDMTGVSNTNMERRNAEKRAYLVEVLPSSVLMDYDAYAFPIDQYNRLKRHHVWGLVYFIERVLFKLEKWKLLR